MPLLRPSQLPVWAVQDQVDPVSNQNNVLPPPAQLQQFGWARQQFPPRNWFNWLGRLTYQWLSWLSQQEDQSVVTDGNGVGLFPTDNALITLVAVDNGSSAAFLFAIGTKLAGQAPILIVQNSNILGLGVGTIAGDQPITGGAASNIIVWGQTKVIAI